MVKNIPTIERSTKLRFGKYTLENQDQAENTIIFNASNVSFDTPEPNAVYLSPIRLRTDYEDKNIVLLMYNKLTHEITESGEAATEIIETTINGALLQGNVAEIRTMQLMNTAHNSMVTEANVGIVNLHPEHTLSIGSNVYFDDAGANVVVIDGGVSIDGNLVVHGGVTTYYSENFRIGDSIIELGKDNYESNIEIGRAHV